MNKFEWYGGNIVVATFLCLNIIFLSAAGAPLSVHGLQDGNNFLDVSFHKELVVNNRTVRCSGREKNSHYPSPMYTCDEISVDGVKLYHGYATEGSSRNKDNCNSGCPCGTNKGHPNDIQALCAAMLKAHGVDESLIAAYVVKPSCPPMAKQEARVKLYYDEGELIWEDLRAQNGYINVLQCLTTKHLTIT